MKGGRDGNPEFDLLATGFLCVNLRSVLELNMCYFKPCPFLFESVIVEKDHLQDASVIGGGVNYVIQLKGAC